MDVQLPIDALVMGLQDTSDLAVLATADTDLLPAAVEGLVALRDAQGKPDVAVIDWAWTSQHLEFADVPVRWIGKRDYEPVRNRIDFNLSPADRRTPRT